ncbi:MAG: VWA domain-containing protein [Lachnospiraceae bacterium]|nr:VWA domain-containing protein [Lachnospiraceae bacterium]
MPVQFTNDALPITNQGERHIPAVLLVDTSGSMSGAPINELNQGLREFGNAIQEDPLALGRAEVCVISFNSSVQVEMGFRPAADYEAPVLSANGLTSFNEAIQMGLDIIESRKQDYRAQGVSYYRPWLFVLTDGAPTDTNMENAAKSRLQDAIRNKKVTYMPMGIGDGADTGKLQEYYPPEAAVKPVLKADAKNFKEAFVWLSASISVISNSDPNNTSQVNLPPTPSIITVGL